MGEDEFEHMVVAGPGRRRRAGIDKCGAVFGKINTWIGFAYDVRKDFKLFGI